MFHSNGKSTHTSDKAPISCGTATPLAKRQRSSVLKEGDEQEYKYTDGLGRRPAGEPGSIECPDVGKCADGLGRRPTVVPGSYGKPRERGVVACH